MMRCFSPGLLIASLLLFLFVDPPLRAQTIHAVLIVDTNDGQIGPCCNKDLADMSVRVENLARQIGYKPHIVRRSSVQFSRAGLEQALAEVTCDTADILFFYYSGHGFADPLVASEFPRLYLKDDNSLNLETLHSQLVGKRPRLCLTLGDCCNNVLPTTRAFRPAPISKGIDTQADESILRRLFVEQRGDILVTTARRGQKAVAHPSVGSFYTSAWLEALAQAERHNRDITWETLLRDAEQRLQHLFATFPPEKIHQSFWKTNLRPAAVPPNAPVVVPVADSKRVVTFDVLNRFLNQLTDEKLDYTKRTTLRKQFQDQYFTADAQSQIYINTPENPVEDKSIDEFLRHLVSTAELVQRVNVVERLSTLGPDGRYAVLTVQEVR